ncbi:MAG: hypothetical protein M3220_08215 [Chloroflexota bacterium]|nr:hypothetical protein [Chloroflexota bacterium]
MSRIVHTQGTPTTQRNRLRRTVAEALRRLMEKPAMDEEGKDLAALIVFALREIHENIDKSASAWEKRDYYLKADRFRREWAWIGPMERLLTNALVYKEWEELPPLFAQLLNQFQDVTVNKLTRGPELWAGAYERLLSEQPQSRGKL